MSGVSCIEVERLAIFFYIAITSVCNSWNVRKRSWNVDEGGLVGREEGRIDDEIVGRVGMPGEWQLKHF